MERTFTPKQIVDLLLSVKSVPEPFEKSGKDAVESLLASFPFLLILATMFSFWNENRSKD